MHLLYVCSDFGITPSGTKGASIHLRAITRELAAAGHEVSLLSPKPGPDEGHPAGRLLPAGCPPVDDCGKRLKRWMVGRGLGDTVAKELRPLLYNAWVVEPALAALRDNPPDVIIERMSLLGHVGLDLAQALDRPLVVEVNALLTEEARDYRSLELADLAHRIEQRVLDRAEAVLPVSDALADRIAMRGVAANKVHVVPNGADVGLFDRAPNREVCRADLGLSDKFVVGFCGSLKIWHGVDVLLESFARLSRDDATGHLLIVGTGPQETLLRQECSRLGIADAVTFTGAVPHGRIPALLKAMDVGVAPFKRMNDFYFSPIKVFEYMAAGTCVVASRIGQIEQVVCDGRTGLLCAPDDVEALFVSLQQARNDIRLRQRLASAAAHAVRQRHTWAHAAERTLNIITQLTEATRCRVQNSPSSNSTQLIEAAP